MKCFVTCDLLNILLYLIFINGEINKYKRCLRVDYKANFCHQFENLPKNCTTEIQTLNENQVKLRVKKTWN